MEGGVNVLTLSGTCIIVIIFLLCIELNAVYIDCYLSFIIEEQVTFINFETQKINNVFELIMRNRKRRRPRIRRWAVF